jgi:hypothetical protein
MLCGCSTPGANDTNRLSLYAVQLYTCKDKTKHDFFLYDGRQHYSALKKFWLFTFGAGQMSLYA